MLKRLRKSLCWMLLLLIMVGYLTLRMPSPAHACTPTPLPFIPSRAVRELPPGVTPPPTATPLPAMLQKTDLSTVVFRGQIIAGGGQFLSRYVIVEVAEYLKGHGAHYVRIDDVPDCFSYQGTGRGAEIFYAVARGFEPEYYFLGGWPPDRDTPDNRAAIIAYLGQQPSHPLPNNDDNFDVLLEDRTTITHVFPARGTLSGGTFFRIGLITLMSVMTLMGMIVFGLRTIRRHK